MRCDLAFQQTREQNGPRWIIRVFGWVRLNLGINGGVVAIREIHDRLRKHSVSDSARINRVNVEH